MKIKNIIFTFSIIIFPIFAQAEKEKGAAKISKAEASTSEKSENKAKEKIVIQAKGMVCSFCAQGIEKKFKALSEIEKINVSLETKKIDLDLKEGKTVTDEQIKKILTESGYELVKIERPK